MNTENNKSNLSGAEAPNSGGQISEAAPTSGQSPLLPNVKAQRWEQLARDVLLGAQTVTSADIRCSALFGSVGLGSYSEFESFFMEAASGPGYGEETCSDLKWILPIFYYKLCSRAEEVAQQNLPK